MEIKSLVSGLPRAERERARIVAFQAWFDDSGKGAANSPVYCLAGYSARIEVWQDFVDEWRIELDQSPRLKWLHTVDAYNFRGEFGCDEKTKVLSEWVKAHGPRNKVARNERLTRFAKIITKHLTPASESHGLTWLAKHTEYDDFVRQLTNVKTATIQDLKDLERIKNPYYVSFQEVLGQELKLRAIKWLPTHQNEQIEILFDEGIDDLDRLEAGFKDFVEVVRSSPVPAIDYLQNKTAEFRDDKKNLALQASDLLAWHMRRLCYDIWKGNERGDDPVWNELRRDLIDSHDPLAVKFYDVRYETKDWNRVLTNVRVTALRQLGILLPGNW